MNRLLAIVSITLAYIPTCIGVTSTERFDQYEIECQQTPLNNLRCNYRSFDGSELDTAVAKYREIVANGRINVPTGEAEADTVLLFLVDMSTPIRDGIVLQYQMHIADAVSASSAKTTFELATFGSDLTVLCELGCGHEDIAAASQHLTAHGQTTELYRNVLTAIKQLRQVEASHRKILLLSDGLAEDLAYYHADAVVAAREGEISISGIGYPLAGPQAVALQTLRRLSEDTGGLFVEATPRNFNVASAFFAEHATHVHSTGAVEFDLGPFVPAGINGNLEISLNLGTNNERYVVQIPAFLPTPTQAADSPFNDQGRNDASAPGVRRADKNPKNPLSDRSPRGFWYGLPAILFGIVLFASIAIRLATQKRRDDSFEPIAINPQQPRAYLIPKDDLSVRHEVDSTPWRIGRSRKSDLRLTDSSVSRLHAEIRRDALDQYTLQDLDSLNGVFVNGDATEFTHLDENDRVEIGDVTFTFKIAGEATAPREPSVVVGTIRPR